MNRETAELLRKCIGEKKFVSITGSGGKTTLLCFLAEQYRLERGLATTSTKIRVPVNFPLCADPEACRNTWNAGGTVGAEREGEMTCAAGGAAAVPAESGVLFAGTPLSGRHAGKLGILPEPVREMMFQAADRVFIEADGSRGLPLKCAAPWEPVILPETELVFCVAGLSALGRPLGEVCYRCPEGREREIVSEGTVAELIAAERERAERAAAPAPAPRQKERSAEAGFPCRLSFSAVLNQCDDESRRRSAEGILGILKERYRIDGICTNFTPEERRRYR